MNWRIKKFDSPTAVAHFLGTIGLAASFAKVVTTLPKTAPQPGDFYPVTYSVIYPSEF